MNDENFHLRHAVGIEVAADGRTRISAQETYRRGLLAVGRKLLTERERCERYGVEMRKLNAIETCALDVARLEALGR